MPGTPFELVVFDCDGVLVDSEPVANRVFAEALCEIGLDLGYEQVSREFIGLTLTRCTEIIAERLGGPVPDRFLERLQSSTFDAFRQELHAVRGIERALDRIDLPTCVASSGEHEKMRLTLGLTGLLPRFSGRLYSATEVPRGKPWPDLFLHAAESMAASPSRCAVVEDSLPGVQAARAAGMQVFGYVERSDPAALAAAGAVVFDEMSALPGLLREGISPA